MAVQPSRADVHVDGQLTNLSVAFFQDATNFVADRAFPTVSVQKQTDLYFTWDRGNFNRDEMKLRARRLSLRARPTPSAPILIGVTFGRYTATLTTRCARTLIRRLT